MRRSTSPNEWALRQQPDQYSRTTSNKLHVNEDDVILTPHSSHLSPSMAFFPWLPTSFPSSARFSPGHVQDEHKYAEICSHILDSCKHMIKLYEQAKKQPHKKTNIWRYSPSLPSSSTTFMLMKSSITSEHLWTYFHFSFITSIYITTMRTFRHLCRHQWKFTYGWWWNR